MSDFFITFRIHFFREVQYAFRCNYEWLFSFFNVTWLFSIYFFGWFQWLWSIRKHEFRYLEISEKTSIILCCVIKSIKFLLREKSLSACCFKVSKKALRLRGNLNETLLFFWIHKRSSMTHIFYKNTKKLLTRDYKFSIIL